MKEKKRMAPKSLLAMLSLLSPIYFSSKLAVDVPQEFKHCSHHLNFKELPPSSIFLNRSPPDLFNH